MTISLASSMDVLVFILFCSLYVCSTLWIYGDAATRGAGWKGLILPVLFVTAGTLALVKGLYMALLVWPVAYIAWFFMRPAEVSHE